MINNRNVSIITDDEGESIAIINDKKFRGLTKRDWDLVEEYLKGYVMDCYEITETAETIFIGTGFPDEYASSNSRIALKGARRKAKAIAAQGIPELIKIASNPRWEENKEEKHDKDAKYGWYRYNVRFGIPVYNDKNGSLERYNVFSAVLLIRHSEDGHKYLHDLITIKKRNEQPA